MMLQGVLSALALFSGVLTLAPPIAYWSVGAACRAAVCLQEPDQPDYATWLRWNGACNWLYWSIALTWIFACAVQREGNGGHVTLTPVQPSAKVTVGLGGLAYVILQLSWAIYASVLLARDESCKMADPVLYHMFLVAIVQGYVYSLSLLNPVLEIIVLGMVQRRCAPEASMAAVDP